MQKASVKTDGTARHKYRAFCCSELLGDFYTQSMAPLGTPWGKRYAMLCPMVRAHHDSITEC